MLKRNLNPQMFDSDSSVSWEGGQSDVTSDRSLILFLWSETRSQLAAEHQDLSLAHGHPGPAPASAQGGALHCPTARRWPHPDRPSSLRTKTDSRKKANSTSYRDKTFHFSLLVSFPCSGFNSWQLNIFVKRKTLCQINKISVMNII